MNTMAWTECSQMQAENEQFKIQFISVGIFGAQHTFSFC